MSNDYKYMPIGVCRITDRDSKFGNTKDFGWYRSWQFVSTRTQICINTVVLKATRKMTIIEELSPKDLQQLTHLSRQWYTRGRWKITLRIPKKHLMKILHSATLICSVHYIKNIARFFLLKIYWLGKFYFKFPFQIASRRDTLITWWTCFHLQ